MGQDTGKRGIASVGGYLPCSVSTGLLHPRDCSSLALVGVMRDTAQRRDGMKMH